MESIDAMHRVASESPPPSSPEVSPQGVGRVVHPQMLLDGHGMPLSLPSVSSAESVPLGGVRAAGELRRPEPRPAAADFSDSTGTASSGVFHQHHHHRQPPPPHTLARDRYGSPIKDEPNGTASSRNAAIPSPPVAAPPLTESGGWEVYSGPTQAEKVAHRGRGGGGVAPAESPSIQSVSSVSSSDDGVSPMLSPSASPTHTGMSSAASGAGYPSRKPFLLTQCVVLIACSRVTHDAFRKHIVSLGHLRQLRLALQHDFYTALTAQLGGSGASPSSILDPSDLRCGRVVLAEPSGSILRARQRGRSDNFLEVHFAVCGADEHAETHRKAVLHLLGLSEDAWCFANTERLLAQILPGAAASEPLRVEVICSESRVDPNACFSVVHPPRGAASGRGGRGVPRRGSATSSPRRGPRGGGDVGEASMASMLSRRSLSPRSHHSERTASVSAASRQSPIFMYSDQVKDPGSQSCMSLGGASASLMALPQMASAVSPPPPADHQSQQAQKDTAVIVSRIAPPVSRRRLSDGNPKGESLESADFFYADSVGGGGGGGGGGASSAKVRSVTPVHRSPPRMQPHRRAQAGAPELELDSVVHMRDSVVSALRSVTPPPTAGHRVSAAQARSSPGGPGGGIGAGGSSILRNSSPARRSPFAHIGALPQGSKVRSYSGGGGTRPPSQRVSPRASARAGPRFGVSRGTTPAAAVAGARGGVLQSSAAVGVEPSYRAVHQSLEEAQERMASMGREEQQVSGGSGGGGSLPSSAPRPTTPSKCRHYHIVMAPNGALLRETESLSSPIIPVPNTPHATLPAGTVVEVSETRSRRARIVSPIPGWLSVTDADGVAIIRPLQW